MKRLTGLFSFMVLLLSACGTAVQQEIATVSTTTAQTTEPASEGNKLTIGIVKSYRTSDCVDHGYTEYLEKQTFRYVREVCFCCYM